MIAYTGFDNPHQQTCTCSNCGNGYTFASNYDRTGGFVLGWGNPKPTPAQEFAEACRKTTIYYDSIAEARQRAVAPRPDPIVRRLDVAARDPLRHHKLRCMTRRPRLSLLERVLS